MNGSNVFWFAGAGEALFGPLGADVDADVAIVGAGAVGLHCALRLAEAGIDVAVFEARRIGRQATGLSTAKVTSQHGAGLRKLARDFGADAAARHARANQAAVEAIAAIAARIPGGAGLEPRAAFVFARTDSEGDDLREEAALAARFGLPADFSAELGLPFATRGGLRFAGQFQFDPYLYLRGAARLAREAGARLYEDSRVEEIEGEGPFSLHINGRVVRARRVIAATQMPIVGDGKFYLRAFPFAHAVLSAPAPQGWTASGVYLSCGEPGLSVRTAERGGQTRLIIAGPEFRPGNREAQAEAIEQTQELARRELGVTMTDHLWTNRDYRSMDGLPFVGAAAPDRTDLFVAVGFGAWGITQSHVAAEVLAARLAGAEHPCAALYAPERVNAVAGGPTFVVENVRAVAQMAQDRYLDGNTVALGDIAPGEGGVVRSGDELLAVLRGREGSLSVRSARCTHLGCTVEWNSVDRTWDCSCHASRFDETGAPFCGPATTSLEDRPDHAPETPA